MRVEFGDLVACPNCFAACRVGSEYHRAHNGRCDRCNRELTTSAAARRKLRPVLHFSVTDAEPVADEPTLKRPKEEVVRR